MKKLLCFILIFGISFSAFSFPSDQYAIDQISNALVNFTNDLHTSVPNLATQQNVWADAYIGKLIPSVPPHFGGGASIGAVLMDTSSLKDISNLMGISFDFPVAPLPTVALDLRIGGLFIPFDLGVNAMNINNWTIKAGSTDLTFNFKTAGADIRFPLIQQNVVLPNLSLGISYQYSEGSVKLDSSTTMNGVSTDANAIVNYKTNMLGITAQLSKQVLFLVPYGGFRAIMQQGSYNWNTQFNASVAGNSQLISANGGINKQFGDNFICQGFFGLGLNFFVVQKTIGASFEFTNQEWGGSLSVRLKL